MARNAVNRLRWGKRWQSSWIQRISPWVNLRVFGNGRMMLGRNLEIASGCDLQVHGEGELTVGNGTYINRYCMISCHSMVTIGAHCMFGPGVRIFDNNHKFTRDEGVKSELTSAPVIIGDNCWIASNVVILKGAEIGKKCVVGTGCVVSGHIPDGSIVRLKQEQSIGTII